MDMAARLKELKSEYAHAQAELMELDRHRQELRDGMLRVAGAIQVLEEFSRNTSDAAGADAKLEAANATVAAKPQPAKD